MNVVLDTNVLISLSVWETSEAKKLLDELVHKNINIFSSEEIKFEYVKVLRRDFELSDNRIEEMLEKIFFYIDFVEPAEKVDIVKDDPTDNKIIECAIASNSEYIITYDKHLLDIKKFRNIKMIKPKEAFQVIK